MITSIILAASIGYSPDLDRVKVVQPWPRLAMASLQRPGDGTLPLTMGDPADHKPKPKPKKKHYCPPTCVPCTTCAPHPSPHTTCAPRPRRPMKKCCPPPCPPRPCPPPVPHTTCAPRPCPPPEPYTTCAPVRRGCFIFRRSHCW